MDEYDAYEAIFAGDGEQELPHHAGSREEIYEQHVEHEIEDNSFAAVAGRASTPPHWSMPAAPDGWKAFGTRIEFTLDGADAFILQEAKLEQKELVDRWVTAAFGRETDKTYADLTLEHMSKMWISGDLLRDFLEDINTIFGDSEKRVDEAEFNDFIQVELLLMFYQTSPECYFTKRDQGAYFVG